MSVQEHTRALGTRLTPIQVALVDDESDPIDLTGLSVDFYMYNDLGTLVVDGGSCTITSDENGLVQYSFAADDVDTAGVFWGYFQVYAAASPTVYDRYPAGREFRIEITEGN